MGLKDTKGGQGRKRCTTPKDEQYLRIQYLRNRTLTAPHLKNQLLNARQVNVSTKTIMRLKEVDLKSRRSDRVPRLTGMNMNGEKLFLQMNEKYNFGNLMDVVKYTEGQENISQNVILHIILALVVVPLCYGLAFVGRVAQSSLK